VAAVGKVPSSSGLALGEDPFAVLGLEPDADDEAVRRAYRAALRAHPPASDPEGFKRVRAAYEALRDGEARRAALLLARPWLEGLALPSEEELGAVRPGPLPAAEVAASLRWVAVDGTDLVRTDFAQDLRPPPAPPWA
jgi:curved DNA-binding protein CbpA